jgi:hypothetical protein
MTEGDYETATDVVAKDYCFQQFHSGALLPLRHGQGGRNYSGAGMRFGHRVDVISFIGMREHAIR